MNKNQIDKMEQERDKWLRVGSEIIEELDTANHLLQQKDEEIKQLKEERNALLEGLKWYADAQNYVQQYQPVGLFKFKSRIDDDNNGGLARSIIAKIEPREESK